MKIFTKFWFDEIEIKSTAYWNRFCQFLGVSKKSFSWNEKNVIFEKKLKIQILKIFDPKSIFHTENFGTDFFT